ncbi:hypothetical protein BU16DRAFT_90333 [Lophium mytilinum]|uniref:Uncharacterized protein n=1 Tax=Lophium mytilinum TaxID=390894 RepID=A0A6A6QLB9_9PEZI|nr:hypothetical protein BU16DRAFT_90333 [Lophium mytilinum]
MGLGRVVWVFQKSQKHSMDVVEVGDQKREIECLMSLAEEESQLQLSTTTPDVRKGSYKPASEKSVMAGAGPVWIIIFCTPFAWLELGWSGNQHSPKHWVMCWWKRVRRQPPKAKVPMVEDVLNKPPRIRGGMAGLRLSKTQRRCDIWLDCGSRDVDIVMTSS